jgi:hypothetical protein
MYNTWKKPEHMFTLLKESESNFNNRLTTGNYRKLSDLRFCLMIELQNIMVSSPTATAVKVPNCYTSADWNECLDLKQQ